MMTAPCVAMKGRVRHQRIASWDGVSPAPSAIALYASAACSVSCRAWLGCQRDM